MDIRGARLLVIGGAGFIGSHLVDALTRHDVERIVVFDNCSRGTLDHLSTALADPRVEFFEPRGDIMQPEVLAQAMRGIDGVFHLAALWLLHCQEYPRSAVDVNIVGTLNVLECCRQAGVKRLVLSSSASVYGDAVEVPMTEDHPFNNQTLYGATKIAGEQLCRAYFHRYGLPYVALRYMNVYGARQDSRGAYTSVIARWAEALEHNEPIKVTGDGSQRYDFVYVGDCAEANLRAMAATAADAAYNIGTGVGTSLRDLASALQQAFGRAVPVEFGMTGPTFVTNRVGSTAQARADLQFEAAVSLDEGLRRYREWRERG